ncbi:MAG: Ig-like domain-containing protein [Caldilineaceae bacterium]
MTTLISFGLSLLLPQPAWAQTTVEPPVTVVAEVETPIQASNVAVDCNSSPFGNLLLVGGEREIFVSYKGGAGPYQNWLAATRLDLDANGKLQPQGAWLPGNGAANLTNVGEPAATVADLDADGKVELIQALRDADGQFLLVEQSNTVGFDTWQANAPNHQGFATASGNLTRSTAHDDEVVVVSRSPVDSLNVQLVNGGNTGTLPADLLTLGIWRSVENFRNAPQLLSVATGDLDGDGFNDEIVVALLEADHNTVQLLVLEYTPGYQQGSGSNYQNNVKELATTRVEAGKVYHLQVAAADIDGDFQDEIMLAYDQGNDDNDGYSNKITVRSYDFTTPPQGALITQLGQWVNPNVRSNSLALAAADSDGDGAAEVIVAYADARYGLTITSLDAEVATMVAHNQWQNQENFRNQTHDLALAAADLNRDGLADIVAAFRDGGDWLQTVRIGDSVTATLTSTLPVTGTYGMSLVDTWRNGAEGRAGATHIQVRLGDWDNDSLKAQYAPALGGTLKCKQVVEPQISSAVFVPPFWQQIQGGQYIYGSVGKTESKEKTTETALTSSYSHSASGYFGVGMGVEGEVFSFESSLKLTAGYEFAATATRTGSQSQGQSIAVGWTNFYDFLVVDDTTYDCYSYQLTQNGAAVDGAARFCENKGLKNRSLSLDAWDMREDIDLQYAPVVRDWSNLALFRGFAATQSSAATGVNSAALAADNNLDGTVANGSVMQTQAEDAPWWQIDLGTVQEITKIRVWNRTNVGCPLSSCMNQLTDFHIFISETEPGAISNDPAVLKAAPGVVDYFHTGVGGRVTTFRTLDGNFQPVRGRYVRVQLAGRGTLALAEVQVFGPNHVEPDRYPVAVTDPDGKSDPSTGKYIPGTDGWFTVQLYNPETGQYEMVRTRGNLLWNGANYNVLKNQQIGDGDSTLTWSLGTTTAGASSTSTSTSHTVKVGAEFDVEAGIIPVKVQTGGSYEYGTGFGTENTQTLAWEKGFELDGGVQGFPRIVEGQAVQWPSQCRYGFQPYYYELSDESAVGYAHKFLVLDYIVPEHLLSRNTNLDPCRLGSYKSGNNRAPQVNGNPTVVVTSGSSFIDVLANVQDPDNDPLSLQAVGGTMHGVAVIVENRIRYTPTAGYVGEDQITYTVSDGFGGEATGHVTVMVGGPAGTGTVYLPLVAK